MIKITADKVKVWKNKKEDGSYYFTYSISSKKQDGTYDYMSKIIRFMKDKEPQDTCEIMIENAFQSFYVSGDKKNDYLMVLSYDVLNETNNSKDEVELTDDDLPF